MSFVRGANQGGSAFSILGIRGDTLIEKRGDVISVTHGRRAENTCFRFLCSAESEYASDFLDPNRGGAVDKIFGGWQVNVIASFMSGKPLKITGGSASQAFAGGQRPNWSGQDARLSGDIHDRLDQYFDISQFSKNDPFTFGNAPRTMPNLRSHGVSNFDISVFKNTRITERFRLQFRAEAFNAFNRVEFAFPNQNINSNAFGEINSQANSPRDIQLALKLLF